MKKNLFLRIALLMLVATFAMSGVFIGSSTSAKYATTAEVSAEIQVAKFDIKVNDSGNIADQGLYPTGYTHSSGVFAIWEADFSALENTTVSGGTAYHVLDNRMAPGTGGRGTLRVKNDSDVTVEVSLKAGGSDTLDSRLENVVLFGAAPGTKNVAMSSNTADANFPTPSHATAAAAAAAAAKRTLEPGDWVDYGLCWMWGFTTQLDALDTAIGVAAAGGTGTPVTPLQYSVTVDVVQLD